MRGVLVALVLVAASAPFARADPCEATSPVSPGVVCRVGGERISVDAYRIDELRYQILAVACFSAPGYMVVGWGVTLSDGLPWVARVLSAPTDDPACPHRALADPAVGFGLFDPPAACGTVFAFAFAQGASKTLCEYG